MPTISPMPADNSNNLENPQKDVLEINLHQAHETNGVLDESYSLTQLGAVIETIMRKMFGQSNYIPVKVKGTESEIQSFKNALYKEKDYLEALKKVGPSNPRSFARKGLLDKAIAEFQKVTKLKWPFK